MLITMLALVILATLAAPTSTLLFAPLQRSPSNPLFAGRRELLLAPMLIVPFLSPSPSSALGMAEVLQPLRILNQNMDDVTRLGGELVDPLSADGKKVGSLDSLVKLRSLLSAIAAVSDAAATSDPDAALAKIALLGVGDPVAAPKIKRVFNAYSDNIFFSRDANDDKDRANVYMAGGATPTSKQSLLYLLRNEIIGGVQDVEAEAKFLKRGGENDGGKELVELAKELGAKVASFEAAIASN
ncbi:hypothetical protein TeGR_g1885 [Tetraparma gracilis]|uniref:Uncharacterized protein n=1 Tax=Tetraparma gracilis TaxID=2962635 RepID=A0ABQ6ME97_9STRA|nr:hypothetical protein TeGR_g1885 [Tetraparma gracilis]